MDQPTSTSNQRPIPPAIDTTGKRSGAGGALNSTALPGTAGTATNGNNGTGGGQKREGGSRIRGQTARMFLSLLSFCSRLRGYGLRVVRLAQETRRGPTHNRTIVGRIRCGQ